MRSSRRPCALLVAFHQLLLLGDQVEDAIKVDWLMITEHTFEVRDKDSHDIATLGRQRSIREPHRHVDRFLVMRCFTTRENVNVFPCEPWVYLLMNVRTDIAVPAQFGKEDLVFHLFCHAFQAAL